ncbi:MAG TPA: proline racemase family protein [Acidobacteriota bacterium]|nr:proline racemase family protein [Acidobacteriota bacterium]
MRPVKIISVVDSHTAGEPTRIVIGGVPHIPGNNMREKRDWFAGNKDDLRKFLMNEPRGHKDMFGSIVTAPASPDADVGVLFIDNDGYLDMCVHGSIGTVIVLLELGLIDSRTLVLDTAAGKVHARAELVDDRIWHVTIRNVSSFFHSSESLLVKGLGEVQVDVAYGGNFFALITASQLSLDLSLDNLPKLVKLGMEIKRALNGSLKVFYPDSGEQALIQLVQIYDESSDPPKNLVVFGEGQFDRSPCGTGTCAKMALLNSQGKLKLGEEYSYQSIIGTEFKGRIVEEVNLGRYKAILPEITGSAYITGIQQLILDNADPFKEGFRIP